MKEKILKEANNLVRENEIMLLRVRYGISGLVIPELAKELAIIQINKTITCLNELSVKNCERDGALAINKTIYLIKVKEQIRLL